jgi:tetratricopeptide (TPR) repeat protein
MTRLSRTIGPLLLGLTLAGTTAVPASALGLSGSYLAARQASADNDFGAAAQYYGRALALDPGNGLLQESLIISYVGLNQMDKAIAVARAMGADEPGSQIAQIVLLGAALSGGEGDVEALAEGAGELVAGLVTAWHLVGEGRMSDALARFDKVMDTPGLRDFGAYHKALALALVGDLEGADAILGGQGEGGMRLTRRGVLTHASILSQLDRNDEAIALVQKGLPDSSDPEVQQVLEDLQAGETIPFDLVTSARDGQSVVFYTVAAALRGETADSLTLIYSRLAEYLKPGDVDAILLSAGLLENLGQIELATKAYDKVPASHPAYHIAAMGRAETLLESGKPDAAVEVLQQLGKSHDSIPAVHVTLGDTLRRLSRYEAAEDAYTRAIDLVEKPTPGHWVVYYARGITRERQDKWELAEADFRKALELEPDQPLVLNYLGYSLVEKNLHLDQALEMIERAVAERPNDGYITDSLGWVLYRLGRFEEAVPHMERAVELMPIDPIINDHLGDVLWRVGREREAEFQWRRALSFEPEEADMQRIRQKLEKGLDMVLGEEADAPVAVANDG